MIHTKMKYILLILTIYSIATSKTFAQQDRTKSFEVKFTYDGNGNRTNREIAEILLSEDSNKQSEGEDNYEIDESNLDKANIYEEQLSNSKISIYPNPTKGMLKVNITQINSSDQSSIAIYNIHGAEVYHKQELSTNNPIDLSQQQKGTYLMRIFVNGEYAIWKIIKE